MSSAIQLRPAKVSDRAAIERMMTTVLCEYDFVFDAAGADADIALVPDNYTGKGGRFDVVLDEHRNIVGTVGLLPLDEQRIELRKMYFLQAIRGAGAGRAVLDHALCWAREQGFDSVHLDTAKRLHEALALYKSVGFELLAEAPDASACDYRMHLELANYTSPGELRCVVYPAS